MNQGQPDWDRAQSHIASLLSNQKLSEAWEKISSFEDQLGANREVAKLWIQLLHVDSTKKTWMSEVKVISDAWAEDPEIVISCSALLNHAAEKRPHDEPPVADGPAQLAAQISLKAIEHFPSQKHNDEILGYLWINRANALARIGTQHDEQAIEAYQTALKLCPEKSGWWLDLSTLHKWRGRWQEGLDCALKAKARSGEEKPILWNLAICATALGEGDIAAGTWVKLGIPCELDSKTKMPYSKDLPPVQVRVPSRASGYEAPSSPIQKGAFFEIAWALPFSPCHGVIQSTTFRDALADFGDVVIWDGAPVSVIEHEDTVVPRFPLLGLLHHGTEHKLAFIAHEKSENIIQHLLNELPDNFLTFIQKEKVERVDVRSPEMDRTSAHSQTALPSGLLYGKIVVPSDSSLSLLKKTIEETWSAHRSKFAFAIPSLYEKLKESKKAGQEHQAWRGIEKKAYSGKTEKP